MGSNPTSSAILASFAAEAARCPPPQPYQSFTVLSAANVYLHSHGT
ncbi:hypothetical protein ACFOHY_03235 [Rhizobium rosettiformans]